MVPSAPIAGDELTLPFVANTHFLVLVWAPMFGLRPLRVTHRPRIAEGAPA